MNHIKRAWLSVTRRKGKSFILLIVVFILGNLIAGTFAIKQATGRVEDNLKTKLGFNATVALNYDKIFEDYDFDSLEEPMMPTISGDLIQNISKIPEVKFYDYSKSHYLHTSELKSIQFEDQGMEPIEDNVYNSFNLHGVEHLEILDSKVGRIELTSGRVFNKDDLDRLEIPVIISDDLMLENNLRLDEVIDIKSMLQDLNYEITDDSKLMSIDMKFKVVGTFKPVTFGKEKADGQNWGIIEMMNRIYLPNSYVDQILTNEIALAEENAIDITDNWTYKNALEQNYTDSVFVTESETDLNSFVKQASALLEENLMIRTSQQAFEMISGPMAVLASFANVTLKGAAITTVIVLSLVVILFLRDRKHEMGIYLALGDQQWKVLSQVTLEVVMITLMGLSLSFGTGLLLANKASDLLIYDSGQGDIMIDTESSFLPSVNLSEINEDYTIKLTPSYIISIYALGTVVAVASSVLPMFYVTRMKPKKILM